MEEKYDLITSRLQEVMNPEIIKEILKERDLNIYWGTAPTGKPHLGYFVPLVKIADFLKADCNVTILFADLHAVLDTKTTIEQMNDRVNYYELIIKNMLKVLDVPLNNLKFVRGTEFQLDQSYTLDAYKMFSKINLYDANKAGSEVVKQSKNPMMSSLMYPALQALDEEYLDCDVQFGGVDQRKIFILADKYLPKLGYKKRGHLMNHMLPSFSSTVDDKSQKMSASEDNKIDFSDTDKQIRKKVGRAFCEEGNTNSPLFPFTEYVMFPILNNHKKFFIINRNEKYGGKIIIKSYSELIEKFKNKDLHPADLKMGISDFIILLVKPIRELFDIKENKDLLQRAYN